MHSSDVSESGSDSDDDEEVDVEAEEQEEEYEVKKEWGVGAMAANPEEEIPLIDETRRCGAGVALGVRREREGKEGSGRW